MAASRSCFFCGGASEQPPTDRGFTACRRCCATKLAKVLVDALGEDEAARAVADLAEPRGGGARPMVPRLRVGELSLAERTLLTAARKARATARSEGRGLSTVETRLSLAATALENERLTARRLAARRPSHGDARRHAREMVAKIGMAGNAGAELNTGTATTTATTPRPTRQLKRVAQESLPMSRDGIKAALRKLVERAGMQATAG